MVGISPAARFRSARTIRDIGSYLPVELEGRPYDPEEHRRAAEAWQERSQAPLPASVENPRFFNNAFADRFLLGLDLDAESVRATVDADDAQDFASALGFVLGIPIERRTWPVELAMHHPSFVRAVSHLGDGLLRDVDLRVETTKDPWGVGTLVNEWFYTDGTRLGWVLETYGLRSRPTGSTIHLLVEGERASATDHRPLALVEVFGPRVLPLWEDARREFLPGGEGYAFWLVEDLEEWLPARLAAHRLAPDDLRPS